jgi:UPF0148 protein
VLFAASRLYTTKKVVGALSGTSRDRMKLASELVSKGATMLAEPCPKDGGIQVRYRGKVYCTSHDDLSSIATSAVVSYDTVVAQTREVLLARLSEVTLALGTERDRAKQEQLVSLAAKYFDLLQKLPQK